MSGYVVDHGALWRMAGPDAPRRLTGGEMLWVPDPAPGAPERRSRLPYPAAQQRFGHDWQADFALQGIVPEYRQEPAPHGWAAPVLDTDADGRPVARRDALPDPLSPAERLALERAALHQRRRALRAAGIDSGAALPGGAVLESDADSRLLLTGAVALAQAALMQGTAEALAAFAASLGAGWRAREGEVVATSAVGMLGLAQALAAHVAAWDAASQAHRAAIDTDVPDGAGGVDVAATRAALAALDLSAGWPT